MFLLIIRNSGEFLYELKTSIQLFLFKGGRVPIMGFQSTIESPDSVKRVNPPISIIRKVKKVNIRSHINIDLLELIGFKVEFTKVI